MLHVRLLARIVEFQSHALVAAEEISYGRTYGILPSVEIQVVKKLKHLHIRCVEFAVGGRETKRPLPLGNEQVVEKAAVVSAEVAFGNYERYGIIAYNYFLVHLGMVGTPLGDTGAYAVGKFCGCCRKREHAHCQGRKEYTFHFHNFLSLRDRMPLRMTPKTD